MKIKFSIQLALIVVCTFLNSALNAQTPLPGSWKKYSNNVAKTLTDSSVGIGTVVPEGWQEISYCNDQENGLVISKMNCPWFPPFPSSNDPLLPSFDLQLDTFISGLPEEGQPPYIPLLGSMKNLPANYYFLTGINPGTSRPMLWCRTLNTSYVNSASGPFTSRFIVTPYGRTGINIENPRSALDVKCLSAPNFPGLIVGRQAYGTTNRTQHIHFVPYLSALGYNRVSKDGDLGIFFTDGLDSLGSNKLSGFVIGPWSLDTIGGMRIENTGNVAIGSHSSFGYKLAVNGNVIIKDELLISNTKVSWPDYVFKDYATPHFGKNTYSIKYMDSFISKHHHLPQIPSADEISKNGIKSAEMFSNIVEQMEIMSLQIIELNKTILAQQKRIQVLESN